MQSAECVGNHFETLRGKKIKNSATVVVHPSGDQIQTVMLVCSRSGVGVGVRVKQSGVPQGSMLGPLVLQSSR